MPTDTGFVYYVLWFALEVNFGCFWAVGLVFIRNWLDCWQTTLEPKFCKTFWWVFGKRVLFSWCAGSVSRLKGYTVYLRLHARDPVGPHIRRKAKWTSCARVITFPAEFWQNITFFYRRLCTGLVYTIKTIVHLSHDKYLFVTKRVDQFSCS